MGRKNKNARRGSHYSKKSHFNKNVTFYQKDLSNHAFLPQEYDAETENGVNAGEAKQENAADNAAETNTYKVSYSTADQEGAMKQNMKVSQQRAGVSDTRTPSGDTRSFTENGQHIESIPLDAMFLGNYQRPVSMVNVKKIVKDFDSSRLGVLVVSKRPDGRYAVIDGQHRMTALSQLGINSAACIVLSGMTVQEEAEYFRHQNENTRNLRTRDRFKAGIIAEDEKILQIQSVLVKNGYCSEGGGHGTRIEAVGGLHEIVRVYGLDILDKTLALANATWPGNRNAVSREMLSALMEFANRFHDRITTEQFAFRLGGKDPQDLIRLIRQRNSGSNSRNSQFAKQNRFNACGVLVTEFNKGLNSNAKCRLHMNWDYTTED